MLEPETSTQTKRPPSEEGDRKWPLPLLHPIANNEPGQLQPSAISTIYWLDLIEPKLDMQQEFHFSELAASYNIATMETLLFN